MTSEPGDNLERVFREYLEPMLDELGLRNPQKEGSDFGGVYEVAGDVVHVRVVADRGLMSFGVSPISADDWWDAELLAELLEPERKPMKGIRRLSLEQQAQLLRTHWERLQKLFQSPTFLFTRRTLISLGQQRAEKMFGRH